MWLPEHVRGVSARVVPTSAVITLRFSRDGNHPVKDVHTDYITTMQNLVAAVGSVG